MSNHPDPHSFDSAASEAVEDSSDNPTGLAELEAFAIADRAREFACRRYWTPHKQAAFLRELAATHNVSAAARSVGMSRQAAYQLRTRLKGQPFDLAWSSAFQSQFDALAERAMERAMDGVEVPHFHKGELIHTSRRYDERLTLGLLTLQDRLRRAAPTSREPAYAYRGAAIGKLIARVEHGPEHWHADLDAEYDAIRDGLYDKEAEAADAEDANVEIVDYDEEWGHSVGEG